MRPDIINNEHAIWLSYSGNDYNDTAKKLNYISVVLLYTGSDVSIPLFSPTSPALTMTSTATAVKGIGSIPGHCRNRWAV